MVEVYAHGGPRGGKRASDYRAVVAKEVFDGDIRFDPAARSNELTLTRGANRPIPIFSLVAGLDTSMRRNWTHIRSSDHDVYLLWLVHEGRLQMSLNGVRHTSEEGAVVVFDPSLPFVSEALVSDRGRHESVFAAVPAHMFRAFVPDFHGLAGTPFPGNCSDGRVLHDLVAMLFEEGDRLDVGVGRDLLEIALKSLQRLVLMDRSRALGPPLARERRIEEINAYIAGNLTNPDLSLASLARSLNVTTRYVNYLLRAENISFVALIQQKRLDLAQAWLASTDTQHLTIGQIGKLSGFRSLTQFGRAFRSHFGISPSEFRFQQVGHVKAKMRTQLA